MRKLEVIVLNAQDSVDAYSAGADRLELVSNMGVGGLSPSVEMVRDVVGSVPIPVNVMIRFKGSDFVYDQQEMEELVAYINQIKGLGINGVVFGSLNELGQVEQKQLSEVLVASEGLDITFHRAIDENQDQYIENFNKVDGQVTTVLTSGGLEKSISENIELLQSISTRCTRVLVGGGITRDNYKHIVSKLPNCDFHIGSLAYINNDFEAGIDKQAIAEFKEQLSV